MKKRIKSKSKGLDKKELFLAWFTVLLFLSGVFTFLYFLNFETGITGADVVDNSEGVANLGWLGILLLSLVVIIVVGMLLSKSGETKKKKTKKR